MADLTPSTALKVAGSHTGGGLGLSDWVPELRGRERWHTYRKMLNDALVGASLLWMEMMLRQVDWPIEPGAAAEDAADADIAANEAAAEFVEDCRGDMAVTWEDTQAEQLSFVPLGFSLHEILYKRRDDGRIGWHSWPSLRQESIEDWVRSDLGDVEAVKQRPKYGQLLTIPAEKLLLFRTSAPGHDPEGRPLLLRAYRPYYFRDSLTVLESISAERTFLGLPVFWLPPEIMKPTTDDEVAALRSYHTAGENLRVDELASMIMPLVYDEKGNKKYDFEFKATSGVQGFDIGAIISRHNIDLLMSLLSDFLALGHGKTGTQALGTVKSGLYMLAISAWLDLMEDVYNTQAIPRLLALNGMNPPNPPRMVHSEVETPDMLALGAFLASLKSAGIELDTSMNGELAQRLMELSGLPKPPEEPPPSQTAPPGPPPPPAQK